MEEGALAAGGRELQSKSSIRAWEGSFKGRLLTWEKGAPGGRESCGAQEKATTRGFLTLGGAISG